MGKKKGRKRKASENGSDGKNIRERRSGAEKPAWPVLQRARFFPGQ